MSMIIRQWKCEECGAEYSRYISFGYPEEDFDYKWKCNKCKHVNVTRIMAMPFFRKENKYE